MDEFGRQFFNPNLCQWCGNLKIDCTEYLGHNVCGECREQHKQAMELVDKASKSELLKRMEGAK